MQVTACRYPYNELARGKRSLRTLRGVYASVPDVMSFGYTSGRQGTMALRFPIRSVGTSLNFLRQRCAVRGSKTSCCTQFCSKYYRIEPPKVRFRGLTSEHKKPPFCCDSRGPPNCIPPPSLFHLSCLLCHSLSFAPLQLVCSPPLNHRRSPPPQTLLLAGSKELAMQRLELSLTSMMMTRRSRSRAPSRSVARFRLVLNLRQLAKALIPMTVASATRQIPPLASLAVRVLCRQAMPRHIDHPDILSGGLSRLCGGYHHHYPPHPQPPHPIQ